MKIVLISIVGVVSLALLLVVLSGFRAKDSASDAGLTPLTTNESSTASPNDSAEQDSSTGSSADQKATTDTTEVNLDEIDLELNDLNLDGLQ